MPTLCSSAFVIVYEDKRWHMHPSLEKAIQEAARVTLAYHAHHGRLRSSYLNPSITITLGNNTMVAALNEQWRGKTGPTNVLSFPLDASYPILTEGVRTLGDIILAYETVLCEAKKYGKCFDDHAIHLVVHGIFHLLGYDHETEDDAEEMEDHERRIFDELGLPDPYNTPHLECDPQ